MLCMMGRALIIWLFGMRHFLGGSVTKKTCGPWRNKHLQRFFFLLTLQNGKIPKSYLIGPPGGEGSRKLIERNLFVIGLERNRVRFSAAC